MNRSAHITVLLDRSQSMSKIRAATISGYNEFLDEQKRVQGEATLTLYQFNTMCELRYEGRPIAGVPHVNESSFVPSGNTALVQAMCRAIDETGIWLAAMPLWRRPEQVFFVTVTDGEQNTWQGYTTEDLRTRIEHQSKAYNWHFTYLGANQDAIFEGSKYAIPQMAAMTFTHSVKGMENVMRAAAMNVADVRVGIKKAISYTIEERAAAREDD